MILKRLVVNFIVKNFKIFFKVLAKDKDKIPYELKILIFFQYEKYYGCMTRKQISFLKKNNFQRNYMKFEAKSIEKKQGISFFQSPKLNHWRILNTKKVKINDFLSLFKNRDEYEFNKNRNKKRRKFFQMMDYVNFNKIKALDFNSTNFNTQDLKIICREFPLLETLCISNTKVERFNFLENLKKLKIFQFQSSPINCKICDLECLLKLEFIQHVSFMSRPSKLETNTATLQTIVKNSNWKNLQFLSLPFNDLNKQDFK